MNIMMSQLVKAIVPEFPSDRDVKESHDKAAWYKVGNDKPTLYTPPIDYVKRNPIEIDKFSEAIRNFAISDLQSPRYQWDNLNLTEVTGEDCILAFKSLREQLRNKRVAVDIETRRVEYEDNKLLSIGFATDTNSCIAFYDIPIIGARNESHNSECYEAFQDLMGAEDIIFIWHNGKFDTTRLKYMCNISARVDEDTILKHYACINEKKGTHGLKDLGPLYLRAPQWDDELDRIKRDYCKKNKIKIGDFMYDLIPTEVLIPYMQRDCIATYRLLETFEELAKPETDFIYRKLCEASNVYGKMELAGIRIDLDYIEELEYDLEKSFTGAQKHLQEVAGQIWDPIEYVKDVGAKSIPKGGFNIKSPKQLKWMLEKVIGHKVPSTDAAAIEALQNEIDKGIVDNPQAKEFLDSIAVVRKQSKYMDTYITGIRTLLCRDARIRCTYNLYGTETGRLSSRDPNMQNIPRDKKIKNLFCASPGYKLLQLDYSQAELRVLAVLSGDDFMIDAYNAGKDFHDAVAVDMYGPDFTKEERVMAKTINFGIAYGRGPGSIAQTFNKTMNEARAIIEKWYAPMPKVREYINNRRKMPLRGEPCISMFGRERHFIITNDNLNHVQNEYINTPIQSLASDLTMFSLIEISKYLEDNKIDAMPVITVHDSIVIEVIDDPEIIDTVARACTQIMKDVPATYINNCPIPFKADAEVGKSWGALAEV